MDKFIHYGSNKFDPLRFNPAKNRIYPHIKPMGNTGLWGSPVNSKWGWRDWCHAENFIDCKKEDSFCFTLSKGSHLYIIDSLVCLKKLPTDSSTDLPFLMGLDFEKIRENWDAILLTEKGQQRTHFSQPNGLYGWDCECILVLNSNIIQ